MELIKIEQIQSAEVLGACADILVNAYNAEPWNDQWTHAIALEKLTCFFNSPKFLGWYAIHNGVIVGSCLGNIEPYFTGPYFNLKEMFVMPGMQRMGIGKALMEKVKASLNALDVKTIILFTGKELFPFNFYLNEGFNEMDGMRMMHFEKQ